jgi:hypothetical protein
MIEEIKGNEEDCPPPPIGCECNQGFIASRDPNEDTGSYNDCGTTCGPHIVDTSPSASLIIEYDNESDRPEDSDEEQAQIDAMNAAWNMLQENSDIVEWLVCLVEGPDDAECVVDKLFVADGDNPQVILLHDGVDFWDGVPDGSNAWVSEFNDKIHINTAAAEIAVVFRDLQDTLGSGPSSNTDEACSIMLLASTILHEMLHGCLPITDEGVFGSEEEGGCDSTHMVATSFRWAMAQRFPCMAEGRACFDIADEDMFMNDDD